MAEFAAGIIGIVSAGTKVALVLSQLAADVGSAAHEARMIGGEIRSFCSVLKTLGETIETIETSTRYAHCSELIKDMTDDSLQMFTEILDAVDKLRKMTAGREGKEGNFGFVERVQWAVFKKPKLLVLRAAIEAYKTNLTLMLTTLNTAERATRRIAQQSNTDTLAQDRQDQSLLRSLELDREATLIELAQAELRYEEAISSHDTESPTVVTDAAPSNGHPAYDAVVSELNIDNIGLMSSARNEIQSIRSSLSRKLETDNEALQVKIGRHSKRISIMLEYDQKRLSQRWSQTKRKESGTVSKGLSFNSLDLASYQGSLKVLDQDIRMVPSPMESDAATASVPNRSRDGKCETFAFDPLTFALYTSFVSWIVQLEAPVQEKVLRALENDITRQADGQAFQTHITTTRDTSRALPLGANISTSTVTGFGVKTKPVLDSVERQMLAWSKPTISKENNLSQLSTFYDVRGPTIDLGRKQIRHFPEEALDMIKAAVVNLVLRSNLLVSIPDNLVVCRRLRHLDLSYNDFVTIPEVVLRLPLLETLNMRRNKLCSIPPGIADMPQLQVLSVAKNNISILPSYLGHAPKLILLYAEGNPIEYPTKVQIDYMFPTKKDPDSEAKVWTKNLKGVLRRLHESDTRQSVKSDATAETSLLFLPIRSMSGPLLSFKTSSSKSTLRTDHRIDTADSASQRTRKPSALPGLQYARSINASASFLLDRSQRPPGKKNLTLISTTTIDDVESLDLPQRERLSPLSMKTDLSTVSTPRQEALARLTGLDRGLSLSRSASGPLPFYSDIERASPLPRISISKHRRSRSEHTLTTAKLGVPSIDRNASRRRSTHDQPRELEPVDIEKLWNPASDTSDDESDGRSSMWWKSLGDISPLPRTESKHQRTVPILTESSITPPELLHRSSSSSTNLGTSSHDGAANRNAPVAHAHNRNVSIVDGLQHSRRVESTATPSKV